jgi:NADPH-dependent 2,4-dienoyl-CoA reductase/sulfur reductase-like enzyme/Fe-S-cluster-containing hydrogenase component 2
MQVSKLDVAIIGAGPAGLSAAIEAAARGCTVSLLDLNHEVGGQLVKQIHKFFGSREHHAGVRGIDIADRLLANAQETGVRMEPACEVYAIQSGFALTATRRRRSTDQDCVPRFQRESVSRSSEMITCRRLILATGGLENSIAFPGWTLPGVMGAGAAQTMANLWRVRPGRRALIVGSGNVGLIVAYQLLQAGVDIAAVVEGASNIGGYSVHAAKIRRAGVPVLTSHTVIRASGEQRVQAATVAALDERWEAVTGSEQQLDADTICVAVGLRPNARLALLAGCRMNHVPAIGGWLPEYDTSTMETSVPGLYIAGDLAGIEEASIAMEEGRLAGIAAAGSLGRAQRIDDRQIEEIRQQLRELRGTPSRPLEHDPGGQSETAPERAAQPSDGSASDSICDRSLAGPVAVIDCLQPIPCNPCEAACPVGAIHVGRPITNVPVLDAARCIGCGKCVSACPGLAIRMVDSSAGGDRGTVSFPFEWHPLPSVGEQVKAVDAEGNILGDGVVKSVRVSPGSDRTSVVSISVSAGLTHEVRGIRRND